MRKFMNFAYTSAIALLSAGFFAACSSSDETALDTTNPNYNPEEKSVTTKFVLNVSSAANTMRQTSSTVQKASNFRGFQDAKLVGLATGKASTFLAPYAGEATQTSWTTGTNIKAKTYDLGTLYGSTAVDNTGTNNADNSSHRVVELTLPLTTDAMLVYGRAIPDGDAEEDGKVTMPTDFSAPENIAFSLVSRLEDSEAYTQTCNLAALIMNRIMLSQVAAHTKPATPTPRNGYTQKADMPALTWRAIGTKTDAQIDQLKPLQQNLAKAYRAIRDTYGDDGSVHAGSASSVCGVIKDIYSIAKTVADAQATDDDELNAQRLADVIMTRIGYYFNMESANYVFQNLGEVDTDGSPKKYLIDNEAATADQFASGGIYGKVTDAYLKGFPGSFNLPEGLAQLKFSDFLEGTSITGGFVYKTLDNTSSLIDLNTTLNPTKYTYPAELLYFDNSLLRVNDSDIAASAYPNGYNKWDDYNGEEAGDGWPAGWSVGPVASTTRSVAVKNNINYGVAMLQTNVTVDTTVGDNFEDNRPAAEGVKIALSEVEGFELTGVLIGGQYQQVGWNYLTTSEADANKNFVIYDSKIADGSVPTGSPNYTLVFDNNSATNTDVYVALEFKNGEEKDIYGVGGMIPKGATFYLVGLLDLANNSETITWPTYYAIPPYTAAGGTDTTKKRVFIQDYVTTATFKIGKESLKKAYTTVPDLRASQISLGLSVDLNWRPGLNFETTLGQ